MIVESISTISSIELVEDLKIIIFSISAKVIERVMVSHLKQTKESS